MFGLWRTYSSLDTRITEDGVTSLPAPRRFLFSKTPDWRDYADMNQYVIQSTFPSMTVEDAQDWEDRRATNQPYVFDRIVLADRGAAMRGPTFVATERTASESFAFPSSRSWWSPIRSNVVEFAGLNRSVGDGTMGKPVITYISRQDWGRRMLLPEAHDSLVSALKDLEEEYGYEVNIVSMDKLDRHAQIRLAGRTTVHSLDSLIMTYGIYSSDLDYVWYSREWFDVVTLDESEPSGNGHRVFLSPGFRL